MQTTVSPGALFISLLVALRLPFHNPKCRQEVGLELASQLQISLAGQRRGKANAIRRPKKELRKYGGHEFTKKLVREVIGETSYQMLKRLRSLMELVAQ